MVINSQLAPCQQSYRITLDLTVDEDFNPRQIDFRRVFNLSDYESINTHIEEFWKKGQYITLYRASFWLFFSAFY